MIKRNELPVVFGFGAIVYSLIEVLTRGFTHWTMTVTGGFVFVALYCINLRFRDRSLIMRCLLGSAVITSAEFTVGCIVNLGFHMNVWDYSAERYNILGQICPLFSFAWFLLCIPAALFSFGIRRAFTKNAAS